MRSKYYVHMGPRSADRVSLLWKGLHITLFLLIVISASFATWSMYKILRMYNFNCILYAQVNFEYTYEERMRKNTTKQEGQATPMASNTSESIASTSDKPVVTASIQKLISVNCIADPDNPQCQIDNEKRKLLAIDWKAYRAYATNNSIEEKLNNKGFLNLRKTAFSTDYMCDLMFFSPLASIIMASFLGALTIVGGKGGGGNPGDLFPNPWICVYPFLGLCGFMMVFSFIAQNLFKSGLNAFCNKYAVLTNENWCSAEMDKYTRQFTPHRMGPTQPFYYNFLVGYISAEVTSALWVLQALVYIFRILCLADFNTYVTRLRLADDRVPIIVKPTDLI